jgi:alkylation response protein AidB-like acyl-CoA dehydrogenase
MLLPATECEIIDTWMVGGLRGTGSHDVAAHDLFVPSTHGSGFFDPYVLPEPRYRIPAFCRVIPGLGAMALGIARTAIDTLSEIAGAKTPVRTTTMLRDTADAQLRVSQADALARSARLFLFDSLDQLWTNFWRPAWWRWKRGRSRDWLNFMPSAARCRRLTRCTWLAAPVRCTQAARRSVHFAMCMR